MASGDGDKREFKPRDHLTDPTKFGTPGATFRPLDITATTLERSDRRAAYLCHVLMRAVRAQKESMRLEWREIAAFVGMTDTQITKISGGNKSVTLRELIRIVDLLGVQRFEDIDVLRDDVPNGDIKWDDPSVK